MDSKKKVKYAISLIQFDDGSICTFDESPDGKMDAVQWVGLLAAALRGADLLLESAPRRLIEPKQNKPLPASRRGIWRWGDD